MYFSGQRLLEEFQTHLAEEERRRDDTREKLDRSSKILTDVKAGVEHLSEKLKHLKAVRRNLGLKCGYFAAVLFLVSFSSQCI